MSVSKEISKDDKIKAPAITICALNNETETGWKNSNSSYSKNASTFESVCQGVDDALLISCINNGTYDFDEVIKGVMIDNAGSLNKGSFTEDLTFTMFGKCFTLYADQRVGSQLLSLAVILNANLQYWVFVHDLHFFFILQCLD